MDPHRFLRKLFCLVLLAGFVLCASSGIRPDTAFCQETGGEQLAKSKSSRPVQIEALLELLVSKGLISIADAENFLQELESTPPEQSPLDALPGEQAPEPRPGKVSQPLTEELEKTQQQLDSQVDNLLQYDRLTERRIDELEKKVYDSMLQKQISASWTERFKIGGDIRLRYQNDYADEDNRDRPGEAGNEPTDIDRERFRYRARLGLKIKLIDPRDTNAGKMEAGLRLATGNQDDPVSTNDTLGDMFNKDGVTFDRAYLQWSWKPIDTVLGDKIPQVSLTGGRMPNPFVGTDLIWDGDLNFEGVALKLISDTYTDHSWRVFLTTGMFPLEEFEYNANDKWFYGAQLGFEHKPILGLNYKIAVAYYDYKNLQGDLIGSGDLADLDSDWMAVGFTQGGNSLFDANRLNTADPRYGAVPALVFDFNELSVAASIDVDRFFPVHVILWGEYVKNLGYAADDMRKLRGEGNFEYYEFGQDEGYQIGLTVGYPDTSAYGEWNCTFAYKHLEADAVLDAFTDSDFHGGGTDTEGWILRGQLGLYKNVWLRLNYMSSNEIITDPEDPDLFRWSVDTLQIDVNAAF
jgi:hypothetical protein